MTLGVANMTALQSRSSFRSTQGVVDVCRLIVIVADAGRRGRPRNWLGDHLQDAA